MKKSLILASAAALLTLAGCATPFQARVSRFQRLAPPAGKTFVVQTNDPRLQGGIEFGQYARIVAANMEQQGYREASDPAQADLVVDMRYHVDNGREKVVSDPLADPWFGPFGYYRRGFAWGFYDPFMFGPDYGRVSSYTVYTSELDLDINRTSDGTRVFEGKAEAHSRTDALPRLVPKLITAMFTGFPGNSGETVKITIQPERR